MSVTDQAGNEATATCKVHIPHDKKDTAVDDGPNYQVICGSLPKLTDRADKVQLESVMPEGYVLEQNHPNPFNPETIIRFALPKASHVEMTIYNTRGQVIRRLLYKSSSQAITP